MKERGGSGSVGTLSTFEEEARGSGGTWVGAKVSGGGGGGRGSGGTWVGAKVSAGGAGRGGEVMGR